jgi:hypothetical protein
MTYSGYGINRALAARRRPTFLWQPVKGAALARPIEGRQGENSMLVLLGYFLIAVSAGVAASGIIGYILASMLIRRYERVDRPSKISSATTVQLYKSTSDLTVMAKVLVVSHC